MIPVTEWRLNRQLDKARSRFRHARILTVATLVWLRVVEGFAPDRWDLIGGAVALAGAAIILWGPRSA